ncbi:MAG: hypothetical protein ACYC5N_11775, partial [Endomicrobiales bacterium]
QDTAGVVSSAQHSTIEGRGVLELSQKMQQGYNEIVESIKAVTLQVEQIAAISEESASSAQEISATSEEQAQSMNAIAGNADVLLEHAGKLQQEIQRFKV